MKKLYLIMFAAASLFMASCDKASDCEESQPVKQEQSIPEDIAVLNETGTRAVQGAYPFYALNKYHIAGPTEYNVVYFYSDAAYKNAMVTEYPIECKYSVYHCEIWMGEVESMQRIKSETITIPAEVTSYVLYSGAYHNMYGGYDYRRYVVLESMRYIK